MTYNSLVLGPSGVGMLTDAGELTQAARDSFTSQVALLLVGGNLEGKGPSIAGILGIPFPPVPGPKFIDPDRLLIKPKDPMGDLFWYDPSAFAALALPILADSEKDYQKIIVNNLYVPLVNMLNIKGNIIAPALFDPTCFLDVKVDFPELIAALPNPTLQAKLAAKLNIDVSLLAKLAADLPTIAIPLPDIPPKLPSIPIPPFKFITFPDFALKLLSIPLKILTPSIAVELITVPAPDFGELFGKICLKVFDIVAEILQLVILPKLLVATLIVLLQNMISMLVCDLIGVVLGTGMVVKAAGTLLGLS